MNGIEIPYINVLLHQNESVLLLLFIVHVDVGQYF